MSEKKAFGKIHHSVAPHGGPKADRKPAWGRTPANPQDASHGHQGQPEHTEDETRSPAKRSRLRLQRAIAEGIPVDEAPPND